MPVFLIVGDPTQGSKPVQMPTGETLLGRGPPLNIMDERLSRAQAKLVVDKDGEHCRILSCGLNPCFLNEKDSSELLRLNEACDFVRLYHGDTYFLAGLVKLTVIVISSTGVPPKRGSVQGANVVQAGTGGFNPSAFGSRRPGGKSGRKASGALQRKKAQAPSRVDFADAPEDLNPQLRRVNPDAIERRTRQPPPRAMKKMLAAADKKERSGRVAAGASGRKNSAARARNKPATIAPPSSVLNSALDMSLDPPARPRKGSSGRAGARRKGSAPRVGASSGRSGRDRSQTAAARARARAEREAREEEDRAFRAEQERRALELSDQLCEAVQGTDFDLFDKLLKEMKSLPSEFWPPEEDMEYYDAQVEDWRKQDRARKRVDKCIRLGVDGLSELEGLIPELKKLNGSEGWMEDTLAKAEQAIEDLRVQKTTMELHAALTAGVTKNRAMVAMTGRYDDVPDDVRALQEL